MPDPAKALAPARHEPRDVSLGFMLGLFALIGATLLALVALVYGMFPAEVQDRRFARPFPTYQAPRLQPDPAADMRAFRSQELARLNSAGWVDRASGRVHIPIDQAMQAVAREGIPGWPTATPGAAR